MSDIRLSRTGRRHAWVVLALLLLATPGCSRRATVLLSTPSQAPKAVENTPLPTRLPDPTSSGVPVGLTVDRIGELQPVAHAEMLFPSQPRWASDGSEVSIRGEGSVQMYTGDLRQMTANVELGGYTLLDHSAAKSWMAVTTDQQTIEIRDIKTAELVRTIQPGGLVYTAAFSPNGRNLAVGLTDNWVAEIYDLEADSPPLVFSGFVTAAPVYSIQYSADGKDLIWIARATVQVMDLESGELGVALEHEDFVQSLATAPNGSILATAAAGTVNIEFVPMINLWTIVDGVPLGVLLPDEAVPGALAFSPDASLLAAGTGSTIQVYDTALQTLVAQFESEGDALTGLAFSPDGVSLLSTTSNGSITLWQVTR